MYVDFVTGTEMTLESRFLRFEYKCKWLTIQSSGRDLRRTQPNPIEYARRRPASHSRHTDDDDDWQQWIWSLAMYHNDDG